MPDTQDNSYPFRKTLSSHSGATAAVVELLKAACGASDSSNKAALIEWASSEDNLKNLRDKIIACAAD